MSISPAEAFGQAVREARLKQGISQEEAASRGGIDRAYFGAIERAAKTPTVNMIFRVSQAVGRRPSQLLTRAEAILTKES